nr:hypothetical protein [Tanacetum cinerariifolium]
MEKGFLIAKGRGSGKNVKDKDDFVVGVHVTVNNGMDSGPSTTNVTSALESLGNTFGKESDGLNSSPTGIASSPSVSYAKLVTRELGRKSVNFRTLLASTGNEADVAISLESIRAISKCFANTIYGFFLRKWVVYPIVANYSPDVNLLKEGVCNVSIWVKFYGVHMKTFSEDRFSAITTKLDTSLMLYFYTSDMCMESWGRLSYARALIERQADVEWKILLWWLCQNLLVFGYGLDECPKNYLDAVKNLKTPRQAVRGVQVSQNVGFKSTKQVYKLVSNKNSANTSGKKKQAKVHIQEVSNPNLFDALKLVENDEDLGTNERNSKSPGKGANYERIDKLERQIADGKLTLVDDERKPLPKAVSTVNVDGDSEVEEMVNEHALFMASTSLKSGNDNGYDDDVVDGGHVKSDGDRCNDEDDADDNDGGGDDDDNNDYCCNPYFLVIILKTQDVLVRFMLNINV